MSTIASHSPLTTSETVSDRGLVPYDTNRKLPTGNHMTDDVTWSNSWPQYAQSAIFRKRQLEMLFSSNC